MGLDATFGLFDAARVADAMAAADVVVCTLPPSAADALGDAVGPTATGVLLDCAYHPRPTALVAAWRSAGGTAVTGERMLLHQAGEQVRLMTGSPAPLPAMDAALAAALAG
jgi:shikimate dehydrogenase